MQFTWLCRSIYSDTLLSHDYRIFRIVAKTAGSEKNKMAISPPTEYPLTWCLVTVKYIVSIFYRTENQVCGLCVGGDGPFIFLEKTRRFLHTQFLPSFLASFYTKYDYDHFMWNTPALLLCVIPKLPQLHGVRILGINKY